eukprot:5636784-Prymnesium_polylepis.1
MSSLINRDGPSKRGTIAASRLARCVRALFVRGASRGLRAERSRAWARDKGGVRSAGSVLSDDPPVPDGGWR